MKSSTKDQADGDLREMKGKAKEEAGQVTNNQGLEAEGHDRKARWQVQKKVGQVKKAVFGK